MKKGQVNNAVREALNELDRWNDVSGVFQRHTGYYYEIQGVVEDAVHIGIQMAMFGDVKRDEHGDMILGRDERTPKEKKT